MIRFDLLNGWEFKISNESYADFKMEWLPAKIPGTVHTDLLSHKLIEEPFYDNNELKLEWVSEADWNYRTTFSIPENINKANPILLVFEGIDTAAEIYLNGKILSTVNNMFLKYEFEISNYLKETGNILEVKFLSALKHAKALEAKYGKLPVALNSERVFIRKAQYSFGWDWGPSFPTVGIWRPVYLLQKEKVFIEEFSFITTEISNKNASVSLKVKLNENKKDLVIKVSLSIEEDKIEKNFKIVDNSSNQFDFKIENAKLWWPSGEGEQNLYDLKIDLIQNGEVIASIFQKIGIRTISLGLSENDKPTFKLIINNRAIYAKGVNWIPADSFLPRINEEKYRTLLQHVKDTNMNIVRVWGGGFYENNIFYDLCDEMGLLVWQDFMFACAAYPEYYEFISSVIEEVKQNVQRLRHHPSIVIWCGNNENEWIWYQRQKTSYKEMPGYKIYHDIIPKLLEEYDPSRPYWPSSPFSFDDDPNSYTSGNRHEWNIWSKWVDYSEVRNDNSLFVTEFGFQGPANKKTFEKYLSEENWKTNSAVFESHNKQVEGPERIFKFLAGNLPIKTEWDDFIYLAQLNQALALKTCLEHWRFNWPVTNGSIIWQINDCWPVTSWALIDSEILPKIAYFFVKNIFNPTALSFKEEDNSLILLGLNQLNIEKLFNIKIQIYDDKSGELIFSKKISHQIEPGIKEVIHKISLKDLPEKMYLTMVASLYDEKDELIFRNFYSSSKWKHKIIQSPKISVSLKDNLIKLETDKPAYFIDLFHPEVDFNDRGFILLPGESKVINYSGKNIKENDIKIFTLNNYLTS